MGKITIADLEVFFCVGVTDEERANPQRLLLSVEMQFDFSSAVMSDRITKTIDYFAVSQALLKFGEGRSWKLIERLANEICDSVLSDFQPQSVTIEVKKFAIPQAKHVSVTVSKSRSGGITKKAAWGIP